MRIRAFVSIELPDTPAMAGLRSELKAAGIRPSPPEQTHITLRFIGDVDDSKVKRIVGCVERATAGVEPFDITVSGTEAFPNQRRPSVIWLGAEPGDVMKGIADRLGDELRRANVGFDEKPFRPHVTVARARDGGVPGSVFEDHRDTLFAVTRCSEILVMRSELGPKGARHTVLARVPLGTSGSM